MADEAEDRANAAGAADPFAVHVAAASGAAAEEARAYLREQAELARLQKQNLTEQNAFELSHLRWRRFNDQMKGALQIMLVAIGALIVVGIAAAVWNASRAEGIVVDSFAVPPQLAASGLSGDVVADDITNKLIAIRDISDANSLGRSKDVRQDSGADIKVEIPDTGISISEAWRYLRSWLGHEHHLRGSVRLANGNTVVLGLNGENAASFSGPSADLNKLEQKAAEHVFANADAAQFVIYLNATHRNAEALALSARIAQAATENRADFYALWANEVELQGDARRAVAVAHFAVAINPRIATPHLEAENASDDLGHDEEALQQDLEIASLKDADQPVYEQGRGFSQMRELAALDRDSRIGDFNHALYASDPFRSQATRIASSAGFAARLHDGAEARARTAQALAAGDPGAESLSRARYFADASAGDWSAAAAQARLFTAALKAEGIGSATLRVRTHAVPMLAYALAQSGDVATARAAITTTPLDCYDCLVKRGDVEMAARNWKAATEWFARATKAAPSVPFAYAEWGAMLLRKGDFDGAIAKFESAHTKGPHFADPLEMWGEALIRKNHSDLALAKFEEAAKYAPNWGRLHLKWGEAFLWSGDKAGARKQFATAAHLDLTSAEKGELAKAAHG